ncbi:hypothetical protein [Coleofasciculus sp. G2-EDA-02]
MARLYIAPPTPPSTRLIQQALSLGAVTKARSCSAFCKSQA